MKKWSQLSGGATPLPDFQSPLDFETELNQTMATRNPGARSSYAGKMKRLLLKLPFLRSVHYRWKHGDLGSYIAYAETLPGWTRGSEAIALMQVCRALPPDAIVVEIGSFLGGGTVLLAGARKLCGSGMVHCVDPFDASGDAFSAPAYQAIAGAKPATLRQRFDENIRRGALTPRVVVHQGTAEAVAQNWSGEIDLLLLDGDQSPQGARSAYEHWVPFLKVGGIIALHNSSDREYAEGHDGYRRLAVEALNSPEYAEVHSVGSTTFARKLGISPRSPDPMRVPGGCGAKYRPLPPESPGESD